jgi:tRNA(Ile)-lysidine synthase
MGDGFVDVVATGHTQSDQAETVLYRILRGSGTAGVSGVRPVSSDGLVRPLLDCTREQVESYLKDHNLEWREDSTNRDWVFVRNRIRHELLPQLVRDYNPLLPKALAQMAALAQDEEQYWSEEVDRTAQKILTLNGRAAILQRGDLLALPRALSRRVLRRAIELVKGDLRSIDFEHVEGLLRLAEGGEGQGRLQLPDLDVFRSFDWLRIAPPRSGSREDHDYKVTLPVPGSVRIPGASTMIRLDLFEFSGDCRVDMVETGYTEDGIDGAWITGPLELRNWRPGDQYTPAGRSGEKIKFLFQQERIPIWERQGWPVLTSSGRIVWTRRFGVAAEFAASATTRRVVRVIEIADSELADVT